MALIHFDETTFQEALNAGVPVLVDFWATWCTHCRPLTAVMEQLAEDYAEDDVIIGKVDVDQCPELAIRYGVMGVPTVLLLQGGEEKERKVGAMPYDAYAELLDAAVGSGT